MTAVISSVSEMKALRRLGDSSASVGFVPTMGALHDGHLSLIGKSKKQNDITVVSIFINPTQFDDASDFSKYPKTFERDLELLKQNGADYLFAPDYGSLYPDDYRYKVSESGLSQKFCGEHRPGHFDGVLSVVLKLFNIVQPDRAYFGEKDYQQLKLIQGMVEAFFMNVEIVPCPIWREQDGLALSSRNGRLKDQERTKAPEFYKVISTAKSAEQAKVQLQQQGFVVDYVEDFENRRLAAVRLGEVRLIDNVAL